MAELKERKCSACSGDAEPLKGEAVKELSRQLSSDWKVVDEHHLEREYKFDGWQDAAEFTNRIATVAEAEDHHPDITLSYGKVKINLFTHKIGGLSENDFILAAKIEDTHRQN